MRHPDNPRNYFRLLILLAFVMSARAIWAQTTSFTYQGRLQDGSTPANGGYDMQFRLFDTQVLGTGTQQGSTFTPPTVTVAGGIFTVQLDFGVCGSCFNGAPRFLEIAVKPMGSPTFTTLDPRQPITSTPYAIRSLNAVAADALSITCVNCVTSSQIQSVQGSQISGNISGSQIAGTIPVASVPAGSSFYIQNTSSVQSSSNFNISGNGTAGGTLSAGSVNASQYNIGGSRVLSIPGTDNTFLGLSAGAANSSGISNSFVGRSAGINNNGSFNAFFGVGAGFSNISGNENSSFGFQSGNSFTTGSDNSFFGYRAGLSATGSNNTLIGANANAAAGPITITNATAIGANARVDQSNALVLGSIAGINGAAASTNVGIGTNAPLAKLHVAGGTIRVDVLGGGATQGLCLNNSNEISSCIGTPLGANDNQLSELLAAFKVQKAQLQLQQDLITKQQSQIDALQRAVCQNQPGAEICGK